MTINQYDKVLLNTGEHAYIVEILEQGKAYVADIEKEDGETSTDFIYHKDIKAID